MDDFIVLMGHGLSRIDYVDVEDNILEKDSIVVVDPIEDIVLLVVQVPIVVDDLQVSYQEVFHNVVVI